MQGRVGDRAASLALQSLQRGELNSGGWLVRRVHCSRRQRSKPKLLISKRPGNTNSHVYPEKGHIASTTTLGPQTRTTHNLQLLLSESKRPMIHLSTPRSSLMILLTLVALVSIVSSDNASYPGLVLRKHNAAGHQRASYIQNILKHLEHL